MMSCHRISTWHEWNVSTGDVMVTWFALYVNLVTSQWACMSCAHMHGARAIIKMGTSEYWISLTGMPADSNLRKLLSNPDPQCHARVWTSILDKIHIRISCNVPHVTCTLFGCISN